VVDKKEFKKMTGNDPVEDDLGRCNCKDVGRLGHLQCGICEEHNKPRFVCGCLACVIDMEVE
jgi:hypothetical protein